MLWLALPRRRIPWMCARPRQSFFVCVALARARDVTELEANVNITEILKFTDILFPMDLFGNKLLMGVDMW